MKPANYAQAVGDVQDAISKASHMMYLVMSTRMCGSIEPQDVHVPASDSATFDPAAHNAFDWVSLYPEIAQELGIIDDYLTVAGDAAKHLDGFVGTCRATSKVQQDDEPDTI